MFSAIGIQEILLILIVVLILFGNKELAQIARKLGKGWRELQELSQKTQKEIRNIIEEDDEEDKNKYSG